MARNVLYILLSPPIRPSVSVKSVHMETYTLKYSQAYVCLYYRRPFKKGFVFYIFKSTFEKIELILMHYVLKSISLKRDIAILTIFLGGFPLRAKLRNIC